MQNVIVVEAVSTGRYYVEDIAKRGLNPVVFYPKLPGDDNGYRSMRDAALSFIERHTKDIVNLPTDDMDEILAIARQYRPIAVIAGSELGVEIADSLSQALGLPGNNPQTSRDRRDKYRMTLALKAAGLPTIRSESVATLDECLALVDAWNTFPIVLKPLASAGSQGVHFCQTKEEVAEKFVEIRSALDLFGAANSCVLVQEFARGTEFIVNTASREGHHVVTDMWEYSKIPIGNLGNAYNYAKLVRNFEPRHMQIIEYALSVLTALGFEYGPSHTEIMYTERGPLLIETGARPMGGYFPPDVLDRVLHHHIVDVSLDSYIDPERFNLFKYRRYSTFGSVMLKLFIAPQTQKLVSLPILKLKDYMASAGLSDFSLAQVGKELPQTVNLMTASGELILENAREVDMMRDYRALRQMELEDFNLLFSSHPVDVAAATFELKGEAHMELNADTWEEVIDFAGTLSRRAHLDDTLTVTTDNAKFARSLALLLYALRWNETGAGCFRKI